MKYYFFWIFLFSFYGLCSLGRIYSIEMVVRIFVNFVSVFGRFFVFELKNDLWMISFMVLNFNFMIVLYFIGFDIFFCN